MKFIIFSLVLLLFILTNNSSAYFGQIYRIQPLCPIRLYDPLDSSYTGAPIYADIVIFHRLLRTLSRYARDCRVIINVQQSFVDENSSTIGPLADRSHGDYALQLGRGIEFELFDEDQRLLCNRLCINQYLSRLSDIPLVDCFFEKVLRNRKLRYDPVRPNIIFERRLSKYAVNELINERRNLQNICRKIDYPSFFFL